MPFLDSTPYFRFKVGFWLTFAISLLWPLTLIWELWACIDKIGRLVRHDQTYVTVHLLFFAPAAGFFLAALRYDVLSTSPKWLRVVLGIFVLFALFLTCEDLSSGRVGSHQLNQACDCLAKEAELRQQVKENRPNVKEEVSTFRRNLEVTGIGDRWSKLNFNGFVSAFLTWYFITVASIFVWYTLCYVMFLTGSQPSRSNDRNMQTFFQLLVCATLLTLWIPFRVYADWYGNHWIDQNFARAPAIFGSLIALLMVIVFLVCGILAFVKKGARELAAAVIGVVFAIVSFLTTIFPQWTEPIANALDQLTITMIAIFVVVCVAITFVLARFLIAADTVAPTAVEGP